tara:strand:+ start:318 stop:509 length:192 start_codon:yes stop_codon:yes gene_type:complete
MIIDKNILKNLINEEIERSFDQSQEGFSMANETIEKYETLTESQKLNFLEKFINHINENTNIK